MPRDATTARRVRVAWSPLPPPQVVAQRLQVCLISELGGEGFQGLSRIVLAAVEAPVYERLDAAAKKSHPMGFLGRCEAMRAPTTENDTIWVRRMATEGLDRARKISPRVRPLRRARIRPATASATHSIHSDQASHAATRALILPTPRSCSLAPSVTISLYSTRLPSDTKCVGGSLYEARRERTSENTYSTHSGE